MLVFRRLGYVCPIDEMIKVSIGVAIYNSEKYLRQCLDSLVNQTLQDIEIILVSDASPDDSIGIMREYECKYPYKVKVIELEKNTRLSGTRKAAMDMAKGEFFGYVDGDDYVDITMYEKLYTLAMEEKADAVACWICDFDDAIGKKTLRDSVGGFTRIVRMDYIKKYDIEYPKEGLYADNYWSSLLEEYAPKFSVLKEYLYYERQQEESIRHAVSAISIYDRLDAEELLCSEINKRGLSSSDEKMHLMIERYIVSTYFLFALTKKTDLKLVSVFTRRSHDFLSRNFRGLLKKTNYYCNNRKTNRILIWSANRFPPFFWLLTFFSATVLKLARNVKRKIIKV